MIRPPVARLVSFLYLYDACFGGRDSFLALVSTSRRWLPSHQE